jgi:hypothetical protein
MKHARVYSETMSLLLALALVSACVSPQATGQLDIVRALPLIQSSDAEEEIVYLAPGSYESRVRRFSSDLLVLDIEAQGVDEIVIELNETAKSFPMEGGPITLTPADQNQPFTVRGEYLLYSTNATVYERNSSCSLLGPPERRCTVVRDASGETVESCQLVSTNVMGTRRVRYTRADVGKDFFLRFFDPQQAVELGQFYESQPVQAFESEQQVTGCTTIMR